MRLVDLTGKKFGRLTVVKRCESTNKNAKWLCECDCGNVVSVFGIDLKSGKTKSCGCIHSEQVADRNRANSKYAVSCLKDCEEENITSTKSWRRIYRIRHGMIERCYDTKFRQYNDYGGRGISVCEEWRDDEYGCINFYLWAINNGYKDDLTVDRIDVNGNYEPSNCRWATLKEQANNKRNNHLLTYNGKTQTLSQWAEQYNLHYDKLERRINQLNWTTEKALNTP